MNIWKYVAIEESGRGATRRGELSAPSAADARASLRRVGLQVVELAPATTSANRADVSGTAGDQGSRGAYHRWLRGRRGSQRAEIFESISTLLGSGIPLLEAVDALCDADREAGAAERRMLIGLRERLRGGESLGAAIRNEPAWFDASDVAMVEAGQHAGTLADVLREMARRQAAGQAVLQRLSAALAYPIAVTLVGLGVVVFLSLRTLPELARLLTDANLPVPWLTRAVMSFGALVVAAWPAVVIGVPLALVALPLALRALRAKVPGVDTRLRRFVPRVLRRLALARALTRLAQLMRAGVPLVESMRIVAPTVGGLCVDLGRAIRAAADAMERGRDVVAALDDGFWFDGETRRLIDVGVTSGELPEILDRIGTRQERRAERLVDRLVAVLEPAVILVLAALVGIVALAAVLPLVRLQQLV